MHHLSILAEGMRDHDMSRVVKGELLNKSMKMVVCVLAVPIVISAYSTLLILFGHITFITTLVCNQAEIKTTMFSGHIADLGFFIVGGIPILMGII